MIKTGEIYYDTILQTLFIVDAVSTTRVYLMEFKQTPDPRIIIESPVTIFERYTLTNIGRNILDNESSIMQYPIAEKDLFVNSKNVVHRAHETNNIKPLTGDMMVHSFGPENKNISPYSTNQQAPAPPSKGSDYEVTKESTFGIRVKVITPKKTTPKKIIKKSHVHRAAYFSH